ncbi:hypothetical protein CG473_03430 [Mycoplasma testudineum]|nr:hypothetical protein CG473_03430 [Mycoplasma testudineum]
MHLQVTTSVKNKFFKANSWVRFLITKINFNIPGTNIFKAKQLLKIKWLRINGTSQIASIIKKCFI